MPIWSVGVSAELRVAVRVGGFGIEWVWVHRMEVSEFFAHPTEPCYCFSMLIGIAMHLAE